MRFTRIQILIFVSALLLLWLRSTRGEEVQTPTTASNSEYDNDSSSEETVEDTEESSRRKRTLSTLLSDFNRNGAETVNEVGGGVVNRAIPGLPDPATILKVIEAVENAGEKIIPVLIGGNSVRDFVMSRLSRDLRLFRRFKNEIESFASNFE